MFYGFRNRGFATENLNMPTIHATMGIVEGERYAFVKVLRKLQRDLPNAVRSTPHSCHTEEHCCSLHAAHKAAAEVIEKLIVDEIAKVERTYAEEPREENYTSF